MPTQGERQMDKQHFTQRILYPVLSILAVMAISFSAYYGSPLIENSSLQHFMAKTFGTIYFMSISFGTLYVFTIGYIRGASLFERIISSFICPLFWMTKEVFLLTTSHPLIESLYWYFNPLNVWLISLMVMEMGISTLIARSIIKRKETNHQILSAGPVITVMAGLGFAVSVYAWGQGENIYVLFLEGYRHIFGAGV